ncbi:MAG TPA: decaprenyl-phosphate phosphoribosyltransferase [Pyrinomonadaceae bacterium]|nr:decaprenyl-phosphate phosphoribosyltransferase [Pyrinomonadaceae bacterium]
MNTVVNLLKLMRPRQWVKNCFVFMGMLFANAWHDQQMLTRVLMSAAAFSLVASGVYVINDLLDRDQDENHPQKKHRPLAAKTVTPGVAMALMIVLWTAGLVLGYVVSVRVLFILLAYVLINWGYSFGLKHIVLLDVFLLASGFMLRIVAGTTGVGIAPTQWLLLCGLMVALFMGFAKRRAELYASVDGGTGSRKVLASYQPVLLDKLIVITATCVILTYSLYTMSEQTIRIHHTESLIYTVPFVMYAIFRYIYSLHNQSMGSDPALEIFRDYHILAAIVGWLVLSLWLIA